MKQTIHLLFRKENNEYHEIFCLFWDEMVESKDVNQLAERLQIHSLEGSIKEKGNG